MNIIQFLAANWDSVLVVLAFLVLVVVLIKRGETKVLKKILFNLVTQAEKQFAFLLQRRGTERKRWKKFRPPSKKRAGNSKLFREGHMLSLIHI